MRSLRIAFMTCVVVGVTVSCVCGQDRSVINAYKTDTRPTLDGIIEPGEWDAAGPPIVVTVDSPNALFDNGIPEDPYGGDSDLSYQFRVMWEEPWNVYFLYEVTDDIAQAEDPVNLWERDQVETFFDGNELEGNDDPNSYHWWESDETYGKFGVSRYNTFEGNPGVMTDDADIDLLFPPIIAASAAAETGENANYVVELAVSLEKMWEDLVFFDTPTDDAGQILEDSTVVKMTVALSDDDNFSIPGVTERSSTLTYFREKDGEIGGWDQSSFFADLTFVGEFVGVAGDCNGDGVLDAADLQCTATSQDLDFVLDQLNLLPGDLDGNGDVAFADFLVVSANFGQAVNSYVDGDIDLNGRVEFSDFLVLSANFGQQAGVAASIPEPSGLMQFGCCSLFMGCLRRRR